jgi:hypothetical protein
MPRQLAVPSSRAPVNILHSEMILYDVLPYRVFSYNPCVHQISYRVTPYPKRLFLSIFSIHPHFFGFFFSFFSCSVFKCIQYEHNIAAPLAHPFHCRDIMASHLINTLHNLDREKPSSLPKPSQPLRCVLPPSQKQLHILNHSPVLYPTSPPLS